MGTRPATSGVFYGFGVCSSVSYWDLSGSPEAHQNLLGPAPELCSGVHQKSCDLEGVEGATPPTTNHSFKTMTATPSTFTPSTQILEAGEKAQALVDAGNALKPLLPEEAKETLEGAEKIANALTATGKAMQHFGFDEAEGYENEAGDVLTGRQNRQYDVSDDLITAGAITTGVGATATATGAGAVFGVPSIVAGVGMTIGGTVLKIFGFDVDESEDLGGGFDFDSETLDPLNLNFSVAADVF